MVKQELRRHSDATCDQVAYVLRHNNVTNAVRVLWQRAGADTGTTDCDVLVVKPGCADGTGGDCIDEVELKVVIDRRTPRATSSATTRR